MNKRIGVTNMSDPVNHPAHYNMGKFEVIDVILDWNLDYIEGNIIKYIARWHRKSGGVLEQYEDLLKAQWYLNKLVELKKPNTVYL